MSTYVIPELVTSDFSTDFEDLVMTYIQTKYNITNPDKTDTAHLSFNVGFFPFFRPYEISAIQTDTRIESWNNGGRRSYVSTGIEVGIRMKRLDRNKVDPQLGNMEREIIRIAGQYKNQDITGIKSMVWDGNTRIYSANDSYAESDWRSVVRYRIYYEKVDIS